MCSYLLWFILSTILVELNANSCKMIPSGSVVVGRGKNETIGQTVCDYCSFTAGQGAFKYDCGQNSAQYMTYKQDSCDGTAQETSKVVLSGSYVYAPCMGWNDVMYRYTGQNCTGELMANATAYAQWGPLNECFIANSVDIIIEECQTINGLKQPIAEIWHPPNYKCEGNPWGTVCYDNCCTPPYQNHTELLTLLVNPCID